MLQSSEFVHMQVSSIQMHKKSESLFPAASMHDEHELDSLCWFSQRRIAQRHIFGGAHPGGYDQWPPASNPAEIFVQYTYPKFHHPMFTCSEVIVLTNTQTHKQTKRRRRKHPSSALWYDVG